MDALTHNIEAFLSPGFHPMCDGIALEGIALISKSLVKAVHTPKDIEARSEMLVSAMMGAVAFQKGLGLNHSLAHALSTVCDLHHGLANAIVLPHVIDFNKDIGQHKYRVIYKTIHGVNSDPEISDEPYSADWFSGWVRELNNRISIPATLSDVGVKEEHLERLTEIAFNDPCHQFNIKPVTRDEISDLFRKALS
jgi:alcohol dehydrogenase class IV